MVGPVSCEHDKLQLLRSYVGQVVNAFIVPAAPHAAVIPGTFNHTGIGSSSTYGRSQIAQS